MQYDTIFLLYQLRYSADYEDWATVENATFWSQPLHILYCGATPMGNPKMPQNSERV